MTGTLYTVSEQVWMPGCVAQWVRAYRNVAPTNWNPSSQTINLPMPGPLLRARVGDMVELTFLNSIDANKFPNVDTGKCDQTTKYPGTPPTNPNPDTYPDCFAGSVFTNVHYHGTHTNPNSTGDNVFLNINPSPRQHDGTNVPVIQASNVQQSFQDFFQACEAQLASNPGPKEWPIFWEELPASTQATLLNNVKNYGQPGWYDSDVQYIKQGKWPQYFTGAYPYCFKLPNYTQTGWPPSSQAMATGAHTHGVGSAESAVPEVEDPMRPLEMGQAPGTHWYHAHKHGSTTINVLNGMTGLFIIEGQYDDDINAFYGPNWTRSAQVMVINQLQSNPNMLKGAGGPFPAFVVNGAPQPVIKMTGGQVQMWRMGNTSSRGGVFVQGPPTGVHWMQLAQDGVQFNDINYQGSKDTGFLASAGNRVDLLVKAPAYVSGGNNTYNVQVYQTVDESDRPPANSGAAPQTLVTIVVTGPGTDMQFMPHAPSFPPFLADIKPSEVNGTQTITFSSSKNPVPPSPYHAPNPPPDHEINGKKFDGSVGASVLLNQVQEWKVVNATYPPATINQVSHPFHIHINPFQIFEIFDPNAVISSANGLGTVSLSGATVTGSGTTFQSTFLVGDFIWINGLPPAEVTSITSNTTLTINYSTKSAPAGTTYQSAIPLYTINQTNPRSSQCVLNPTDSSTWHPCPGKGFQPPQTNAIWWDVFSIPSGNTFFANASTSYDIPGYFKMRSRFVDFPGQFVMHCHILAHEDRGMMTVVSVDPIQATYSHH
jgi:FtsP/CotA-like multicopper oxidase with cupredoxin domain